MSKKTKKDLRIMDKNDMIIAFRTEENLNDLLEKGILPQPDDNGLWNRNEVKYSIVDKKIAFFDVECNEEVWLWNFDLSKAQLTDEEMKAKIF